MQREAGSFRPEPGTVDGEKPNVPGATGFKEYRYEVITKTVVTVVQTGKVEKARKCFAGGRLMECPVF